MLVRSNLVRLSLLTFFLFAPTSRSGAANEPKLLRDDSGWTRLVVTVREGSDDERRYELPVRLDGSVASLHDGGTVALPNATFSTSGKQSGKPVASYTYQNVGLELSLRAQSVGDGIALSGRVESSRVVPPDRHDEPVRIQRTEQSFAVNVLPGTSTDIVAQRGGASGPFFVAVAVEK